jgi:aminoglycoside 6'-N-acetyltransferase
MDMTFRRLTDDDLPMLHAWLNEPGVVRWWEGDDVSWAAVVREYGSTNTEPVEHWLACVDGTPVGWIQCYAAASFADEAETRAWFAMGIDRTAAGIDYLVGEPGRRGNGLGSQMIRRFVDQVVFPRHPDWTQVCASPQEANAASWRALANAGFRTLGTFEDAQVGTCRMMVLDRAVEARARP